MIRGYGEDALTKFEELLKISGIGMEGLRELRTMSSIFERSGVQDFVEFDMSLARGLDYYTGPVFEGQYLGKPDVGAILGGGRYDKLIERFGGSPTPATGISIGIDRLIDVLMPRNLDALIGQTLDVFIAPINSPMVEYAMALQRLFVRKGISSVVDLMDRPLGKLLELADERGAKFTIIVGERDMKKNQVSVRNMSTKSTEQVNFDDTSQYLEKVIRNQ
jgi:histidyl-tRNA synthetase